MPDSIKSHGLPKVLGPLFDSGNRFRRVEKAQHPKGGVDDKSINLSAKVVELQLQ